MATTKQSRLERTAIHEAGHAVVAILLKSQFAFVSIRDIHHESQDGKVARELSYAEGVQFPEQRRLRDKMCAGMLDLREATICMAGSEAERMLVGEMDEEAQIGAEGDVLRIKCCCRAAMSVESVESLTAVETEQAVLMMARWTPTKMEDGILDALAEQARRLLSDNWTSVEAVADLLLEHKHLTFSEVEACVAATKGR